MLVEQNWVAIGIGDHQAPRSRRVVVHFRLHREPGRPELSLVLADIRELLQLLAGTIQPGLNVNMLRSNIPWNSPIVTVPLRRISQFWSAFPPKTVNPSLA